MKRALVFCTKKYSSVIMKRDIINLAMSLILITLVGISFGNTAYAQATDANVIPAVRIADGDQWNYFKGMQSPPSGWTSNDFDDSGWQRGPSSFGYGPETYGTYLGDMHNSYSTVYARQSFSVSDLHAVTGITLSVGCDGPFTAYINGIEVIRTRSVSAKSNQQSETFNISGFIHELFPRDNVISVQCSNDDIKSNDYSFNPVFEVLAKEEVQQ